MGYRYTMIDFNIKEGAYDLYCYVNDECVIQKLFNTEADAYEFGDKFLNKELDEQPA